jgi:hypothetical protein
LFQLATATEEELESLGNELDRVEFELGAAVKSTVEGTVEAIHKVVLAQFGVRLKSSLTLLVELLGALSSSKAAMGELT